MKNWRWSAIGRESRRGESVTTAELFKQAAKLLEVHPAYQQAQGQVEAALERVQQAVETLDAIQQDVQTRLESELEPPTIVVPEPELTTTAPEPLFRTEDDYITASRKLIAYKALEDA